MNNFINQGIHADLMVLDYLDRIKHAGKKSQVDQSMWNSNIVHDTILMPVAQTLAETHLLTHGLVSQKVLPTDLWADPPETRFESEDDAESPFDRIATVRKGEDGFDAFDNQDVYLLSLTSDGYRQFLEERLPGYSAKKLATRKKLLDYCRIDAEATFAMDSWGKSLGITGLEK